MHGRRTLVLVVPAVLAFGLGTAAAQPQGPGGGGGPGGPPEDRGVLVGHGGNIRFNPVTGQYILKGKGTVAAAEAERSLATAICAKCHEDAIHTLKDSVHFSVQGPNPRILFPGGGAHGALDRACGLPGTSALINYNSDINLGECSKCHVGRFLPPMEGAFTSSFAQMFQSEPFNLEAEDAMAQAAANARDIVDGGLDCLICHAEHYQAVRDDLDWSEGSPIQATHQIAGYAEPGEPSPSPQGYAKLTRDNTDFDHDGIPDALIHVDLNEDGGADLHLPLMMDTDGDGQPDAPWPTVGQDRSVAAVLSAGPTTDHACLRCHEHARTGYKRATLFLEGYDVHAAATSGPFEGAHNRCTVCHVVLEGNHKFVRGHLVGGDLAAADYPPPPPGVEPDPEDPTHLTCVQCHPVSDLPKTGKDQVHGEGHLAKIACETCHIPYSGGITYSLYGHGGHLSFGRNAEGFDTKLITHDHMVAGDRADVDADYAAYRIPSVLMWFDGSTSFLAQSLAVRGAPTARITPFKPMANGMVMDGRFFDGVTLTNAADFPYNAHSMYRFYANRANAEVFTALGLLGTVKDTEGNVIVSGLTPDETRKVTLGDLMAMGDPSRQTMAMMQAFPNLMNFSKAAYGYEHYLVSTALARIGDGPDADGDGIIDQGADFTFDMLTAVNMGLEQFKGFNVPMMLPPEYDWYPKFQEVSNVATMKLPDGSFMKLFLSMGIQQQLVEQGVPAEQIPAIIEQLVGDYPAFGRNGCLDCHGEGGVLANPMPVTEKVQVDLGPMGQGEMPVWRWIYYNVKALVDLGLATSNEDVVIGRANIDVAGNTDLVRTSGNRMIVNWFNPAGEPTLNEQPVDGYTGFLGAAEPESLDGTELNGDALTWKGGDWMPVLEPVTVARPNYAILGYAKDEVIFPIKGSGTKGDGKGKKH